MKLVIETDSNSGEVFRAIRYKYGIKVSGDTEIKNLELKWKTANCLMSAGIHTINDLFARSEKYIEDIPKMGRVSINDLKERLSSFSIEPEVRRS